VVIHDEHEKILVAQSKTSFGCLEPSVVEAMVALMAIQLCKELGLRKNHLERDAQVVVNVVNSSMMD
jgi:hypothetical protein